MTNFADKPNTQEDSINKIMERDGIQREERSYTQLGITPEFIWYESEILADQMSGWSSRFKRLVSTMEQRSKEQNKMLEDLINENRSLKAQLKEKSNVGS